MGRASEPPTEVASKPTNSYLLNLPSIRLKIKSPIPVLPLPYEITTFLQLYITLEALAIMFSAISKRRPAFVLGKEHIILLGFLY
jgi:hypothetical protein